MRAIEALMALLYRTAHPYGRPTKGTIDVVEGLTRDGCCGCTPSGSRPAS